MSDMKYPKGLFPENFDDDHPVIARYLENKLMEKIKIAFVTLHDEPALMLECPKGLFINHRLTPAWKVIKRVNDFKADIVFFQIQRENQLQPHEVAQIKGFKINWTGDVREPVPAFFHKLSKAMDLMTFCDEETAKEVGGKFMQICINHYVFKPMKEKKIYDVAFMYNYYKHFPLGDWRHEMALELEQYNHCLRGSGTGKSNFQDQDDQCLIYNQTKIGINISNFQKERYTSDRMLRIMASGTFCLSHWYSGIETDFDEGKYIRSFDCAKEMHELIAYYLKHDKEREKIAKAGQKMIMRRYTAKPFIKQLIKFYEQR